MSFLFNAGLAKCIKRIVPVVKCKNNLFYCTNQTKTYCKAERNMCTSIRYSTPLPRATTPMLFGFSLLGLLGFVDEEIDEELKLINTIKRGILFLQKDDYDAFEKTMHDALEMAYNLQHFDGLTYVYDVLANGAFMQKDYVNAEKLFVMVMQRLMSKGAREYDLNILHISLKLAKIYDAQNNYSKCEIGYGFCLNHLEEVLHNDPKNEDALGLYSLSLDSYARYLLKQGHTQEAFYNFKKSYEMCVKLNGEIFEMNVILLNDMATLSYVHGHVEDALKFLKKAVKIGQHLPDMETFSSVYINLGNIYIKQGMLEEAEKHCIEGMKNAKRHHYEEGKQEANHCLAEIKSIMAM